MACYAEIASHLLKITIHTLYPFFLIISCLNATHACEGDQYEPWSYHGRNGPRNWKMNYYTCGGWEQSPINIDTRSLSHHPRLPPLKMFNYDIPLARASIENNGHTVVLRPEDLYPRYIRVDNSMFHLREVHFHWGSPDHRGSEHEINGKVAAMEVHFVHSNTSGQVAVVAVMLTDREGAYLPELQSIIDRFPYIRYKGEKRSLWGTTLTLEGLLPNNPCSFYRYRGSLTTPPCSENVIWSVCKKPLDIGDEQLFWRKRLYSTPSSQQGNLRCELLDNFRPTQNLNGRRVYSSTYL